MRMDKVIKQIVKNNNLEEMGKNGWKLLQSNYLVDHSYQLIINKLN